jgi:hypothetical protein
VQSLTPVPNTDDLCEADRMTISLKKKEEQLKGINNKVLEAEFTTSKHAHKKRKKRTNLDGNPFKGGGTIMRSCTNGSELLLCGATRRGA